MTTYISVETCPLCNEHIIVEKDGTTYLASHICNMKLVTEVLIGREVKNVKKFRAMTIQEELDFSWAGGGIQ